MTRAPRNQADRELGQAMVEYVSITALIVVGGLAAAVGWPFTSDLFQGLQNYLDLIFASLNAAIG